MEIVVNFSEIVAPAELLAQAIDFDRFVWVRHGHVLPFLVVIKRGVALHLFRLVVVTPVLVCEADKLTTLCMLTRLVRLKTSHQVLCRRDWLVNRPPDWLRFIHVRVLLTDFEAVDNVLLVEDVFILLRELEYLIRLPLLCGLVIDQILNATLITQEFLEYLRLTPDEVDIWRVLWLV